MYKILKIICKIHFHKHRTFSSILSMTITHSKKMLMKCLANIRCQYKVILVFLICIVNTKPFSCWICESRYNIIFYYFKTFLSFFFLKPEWMTCWIFNSIVIIDSLIRERCRLRYSLNDSLNWTSHRINVNRQLILY